MIYAEFKWGDIIKSTEYNSRFYLKHPNQKEYSIDKYFDAIKENNDEILSEVFKEYDCEFMIATYSPTEPCNNNELYWYKCRQSGSAHNCHVKFRFKSKEEETYFRLRYL